MSLMMLFAVVALAFLLVQFDVDPKTKVTDDPDAIRRDKPPQTPPEIRRKIAALKAEGRNLFAEYSKDGREVTDDEFAKLEEISHRQVQLDRLLVHAERWHAVDSDLAEGRGRLGPSLELGPHDDPNNTRNGLHQDSLMKVMRHHLDPRRFPLDGLEAEVHDELVKQHRQSNLTIRGVLVPWNLPIDLAASLRMARRAGMSEAQLGGMLSTRQQLAALRAEERAAGTLDTTAGAGSIPTILSDTMIDLLRARMVTFGLGARIMTGMQGKFAIPRQIQASTFYMVGEGGPISPSNQKIDQVPFSPHTGGVVTSYTRQFLEQTNQDAESFVREDQAAVVARGVEYAAFNGQASNGFPMGILQNPSIDNYAMGTNGGAPTWAMLVALESHIAYFNADVGSLSYVTTALMRGTYKVTLKISGSSFPIYLWNTEGGDAPVNGYPCAISNILPQNITKGSALAKCHPTIFGNWQDMIFAFWSGMDTIVDPYTQADSGGVRIVTLQDFDVNVRHFESFSMCLDQLVDAGIGVPIT
jgi:HK97 family phage major capsid protein